MGNELCVAGGGTPMQVDMLVVNNTEIPLELDKEQDCQRECHHKGWQVGIIKSCHTQDQCRWQQEKLWKEESLQI